MSDLTIGLSVVGGLILAAIFAHGVWTVHRNTPKSSNKSVTKQAKTSILSEALLSADNEESAKSSASSTLAPSITPVDSSSADQSSQAPTPDVSDKKQGLSQESAEQTMDTPSSRAQASTQDGAKPHKAVEKTKGNKDVEQSAERDRLDAQSKPLATETPKGQAKSLETQSASKPKGILERLSEALLPSDESELDKLAQIEAGKSASNATSISSQTPDEKQGAYSVDLNTDLESSNAQADALKQGWIDVLVDSVAVLNVTQAIYGQVAIAAYPSSWRCGSKPFIIEGQNVRTQNWERPRPEEKYANFQAAVQLSNRSGALNEIEFSEFVMKVNHFADKINAQVDFPDMLEEVARAKELDQFASDHDVQLGLIMQSEAGGWTWSYIQDHAAALGFIHGATPGKMVLMPLKEDKDSHNLPLVSLQTDAQMVMSEAQTKGITSFKLVLDAPQVAQDLKPFLTLCAMAKQLSQSLGAKIVDSDGVEITTHSMKVISDGLERLYADLAERDFAAGSALARRLFSW